MNGKAKWGAASLLRPTEVGGADERLHDGPMHLPIGAAHFGRTAAIPACPGETPLQFRLRSLLKKVAERMPPDRARATGS